MSTAPTNTVPNPTPLNTVNRPPIALTIAGTDPSGGAGIHADLKSFAARGAYGTSVITALVAQNTHGVSRVYGIDADFVADQFDSVLGDMPVDAAKTGMLGTRELVDLTVDKLAETPVPHLVVDPVMVSTSGHRLLDADAIGAVRARLLPVASVITPNLPEAALLLGDDVAEARDESQMTAQARELVARGAGAALVKGGHGTGGTVFDVLAVADGPGAASVHVYTHPRVASANTHGTGCTLSAAITAELARGAQLEPAVFEGLEYLGRALAAAAGWNLSLDPAGAHGPVDHLVDLRPVRARA
ncbi:bifunctional hydroxymethylpyrimidine kinase/phosphomethylpyrimidine kinase [Brevibacterium sp. 91QC2O2]|uniref:bifunctional hydroxymethylpyrimidine kinase/phosphomethylpyrimidine kinase n=1 Tax=Brevibacterium sp. 91QC2O2 TaxID=2968458 RepID=UPI00211CE4F3|nr:bifunctional hydroxymethylpyrimidine kinase/phosphomethylpyrimidine kinase [Brevibacterium sp. 91QC2O2]MCQ9367461.1 bifunctional hydroxymethylpyrimidine kinase/phosphomethylpyrimidine kinase [Brevibacterium sp. 91QC2O2]